MGKNTDPTLKKRVLRVSSTQAELSDAMSSILLALLSINAESMPEELPAKARNVAYYNKRLRKEIEALQKTLEKMGHI